MSQNASPESTTASKPKRFKMMEPVHDTPNSVKGIQMFRESGQLSDFTLVSRGGREFKVHKAFLAMKSPVFEGLFRHDNFTENENGTMKTKFSDETVSHFIDYIYTGQIPELNEDGRSRAKSNLELLKMSHMYQVEPLVTLFQEYIINEWVMGSPGYSINCLLTTQTLGLTECVDALIPKMVKSYRLLKKEKQWPIVHAIEELRVKIMDALFALTD